MYQSLGCAYSTAELAAIASIKEYVTAGGANPRRDVLEFLDGAAGAVIVDQMISDGWSMEGSRGLTVGVSVIGRHDADGSPEAVLFDREDLESLCAEAREELIEEYCEEDCDDALLETFQAVIEFDGDGRPEDWDAGTSIVRTIDESETEARIEILSRDREDAELTLRVLVKNLNCPQGRAIGATLVGEGQ